MNRYFYKIKIISVINQKIDTKKSRHPKGCRLLRVFYDSADGELDVVAPNAKDLMQLRRCLSAEVCQHCVAGDVYETKDRVERNIKCNKLWVLSDVNSLELAEVAQNNS